ncbi:uncharacterized protein EI90DRAFT_597697 [Cantharellus anzutake]|uniref:uncharacterized protein n=1 Tax=Cantharellus anzutake TaxID=1750568 RepID=UPI0019058F1F|nr:uncharacterized protein EI90DRAFT_597697 [Cantharellus anzutake]KAF8313301.1 hypothetical protein EI90DRAFT_597697 [Cantharellus anzutake]
MQASALLLGLGQIHTGRWKFQRESHLLLEKERPFLSFPDAAADEDPSCCCCKDEEPYPQECPIHSDYRNFRTTEEVRPGETSMHVSHYFCFLQTRYRCEVSPISIVINLRCRDVILFSGLWILYKTRSINCFKKSCKWRHSCSGVHEKIASQPHFTSNTRKRLPVLFLMI